MSIHDTSSASSIAANDEGSALLLSICLPTYNRSHWLRASLNYSAPQAQAMGGLVEIIISDNVSTDKTPQVVAEFQERYPCIRYSRNETNIGANPNMVHCVRDLARGAFIWVLGDDDFILEGTVAKVVAAIQQYPEIDYIHLNNGIYIPPAEQGPEKTADPQTFAEIDNYVHADLTDHYVDKIADLIPDYAPCFTAIYVSVFRRWRGILAYEACLRDKDWTTVNSVSSHALYIADHMLNLPAYYIGARGLIAGGDCSWQDKVGNYEMVFFPQVYAAFERGGISKSIIDKHRTHNFETIVASHELTRSIYERSYPLRDSFSMRNFITSHWDIPALRPKIINELRYALTYPFNSLDNTAYHRIPLWKSKLARPVLHRLFYVLPVTVRNWKASRKSRSTASTAASQSETAK